MAPDVERPTGHEEDGLDRELISLLAHLRDHPVEMVDPPAFLYARIKAEISVTTVTVSTPVASLDEERTAREHRRQKRRARDRPVTWLAAAAALLVVGGVGGIATAQRNDPGAVVVASAELEPVRTARTGQPEEGYALLIDDGGKRKLTVATKHLRPLPKRHHVEVWLANRTLTEARDLGPATATSTATALTVDLPADLDLEDLPVIELTLEETGGDPGRSEITLLRGELP